MKDKIKKFLLQELYGWHWLEALWLSVACSSIFSISLWQHDSVIGIISAICGTACVILTSKGKLSAYVFGVVQCLLYSWISFNATLYGEVMLNTFYFLPMQLYGFFAWKKSMDANSNEVKKRKMHWSKRFVIAFFIVVGTEVYGVMLQAVGDKLPYIDAFTTIASVIAMWLSCKRYTEQWWIWISIDVFSVMMWWRANEIFGGNTSTLLMWIVFLVNAVYGCIKWEIEALKGDSE